ncbi:hypothetical protein PENSPDRAFT_587804, partial [Peniophora sp. CONT]
MCGRVAKPVLLESAEKHNIYLNSRQSGKDIQQAIVKHEQSLSLCCRESVTFFKCSRQTGKTSTRSAAPNEAHPPPSTRDRINFPPLPPEEKLKRRIIKDFCGEMSAENLIEEGCAVCGCLSRRTTMKEITSDLFDMKLLEDRSRRVTRCERRSMADHIRPISGPVLDTTCERVCAPCLRDLKRDRVPKLSLVNGNWVGEVPPELRGLTFLEQMLVARLRHNACVLKVHASGQYKMRANAVMFSVPMPKVYKVLPPPREEFEEIVAFIFIGPTRPTDEMHARLPSFVRRNKVRRALEWLKLNHEEYSDLEISYKNLDEYPEAGAPVIADYRPDWVEKELENKAVYEMEDWSAVKEGECPLIVHTLT